VLSVQMKVNGCTQPLPATSSRRHSSLHNSICCKIAFDLPCELNHSNSVDKPDHNAGLIVSSASRAKEIGNSNLKRKLDVEAPKTTTASFSAPSLKAKKTVHLAGRPHVSKDRTNRGGRSSDYH